VEKGGKDVKEKGGKDVKDVKEYIMGRMWRRKVCGHL
jgi:hypothetical protein